MAEAGRVFQRRIEKQRKDDRCRLEDANGKRNEWEDRRTISVLAWTVAGRSSDSDGGPWPLYRMYKRHRQWTLLLHASVGRLHFESTSGPGCPRCEWTIALATFSCTFSSDFRDPADVYFAWDTCELRGPWRRIAVELAVAKRPGARRRLKGRWPPWDRSRVTDFELKTPDSGARWCLPQ